MMRTIVDTLMVQSIAGGLLIAFMLLVRKLCAEKISARLMYALWLLVALRMLVPLELPGLIRTEKVEGMEQKAFAAFEAYFSEEIWEQDGETIPKEANVVEEISAYIDVSDKWIAQTGTKNPSAAVHGMWIEKVSPYTAVFYGWLGGVFLTGAYILATNLRYMRRVRRQAVRVRTGCVLPVYRAEVESPFLAGILRRRIYINDAAEMNGRLSYVLAHEMEHAKNQDNVWLLLRNVVCALYWFHPLVWAAAALSTRDCEKACDERVIKSLTKSERVDYAQILFEMSMGRQRVLPMVNAVGSGKGTTMVRIARILKSGPIRRWVNVLMAVIMLTVSVFSCTTGEAAEIPGIKTADMNYKALPHFAAGAGRMLQLADGVLYEEVDGEWMQIGKYAHANAVAVGKQGVFIGQSGADGDTISRLGDDGRIEKTWTLPGGFRIVHMAASEYGIALVDEKQADDINAMEMMASYPNQGTAYLFDPASGGVEKIDAESVYDLTTDEAGRLYLLHESNERTTPVISLYTEEGLLEEIVRMYTHVQQFAAAQGGFFYSGGVDVGFLNPETGETRHVAQASSYGKNSFVRIACHNGLMYAVNGDWGDGRDGRLISVRLNPSDDRRKLTIVNYGLLESERAGYMEKWWRENYPDVELTFVDMYETTQFATALMSGDFEFDIICADGKWNGSYAASGAFLPLDSMNSLMAVMDESNFLPYEPLMTYDGRLYGVPFLLEPEYFVLNTALMKKLNLTWPEAPYSWAEIADWAVDALEGTGYYFTAYTKAPFQYVDAKLQRDGEVILDTPQFRAAVQAHKKLYDAGLIDPEYGSGRSLVSVSSMDSPANIYVPLPTLEGETANTARVTGFYVSAGTKNQDLAEAFLTAFASKECQYMISSEWLYYMVLENAEAYPDERHFQSVQQFGEDALELRRSVYDGIVLEGRNQYMQGAIGLLRHWKDYLDGVIDLDEYIDIAQAKMDMIQYE